MLTVAQFRKVFTVNGGKVNGKIIDKLLRDKPNQQLFAQIIQNKEIRHFMVNFLEKKIYEGNLYKKEDNSNEILFGYLDLPVISFENYVL